jgi:hypothetical protein
MLATQGARPGLSRAGADAVRGNICPLRRVLTRCDFDPLRRYHRWGAVAAGLPILLVIGSGLLLQVKKQVPWVQPVGAADAGVHTGRGMGRHPGRGAAVPQAGVQSGTDIDRVDVRPGKGILKVITKNRWELQIALGTGELLQTAYRRSDLIETLHDGSFFGDPAKLWIFLPSGIVLFDALADGALSLAAAVPHAAPRAAGGSADREQVATSH